MEGYNTTGSMLGRENKLQINFILLHCSTQKVHLQLSIGTTSVFVATKATSLIPSLNHTIASLFRVKARTDIPHILMSVLI